MGLDAQLADSLSTERATAKAVMDRLVKSEPMGRGTPCCSLSGTSDVNEVTPELKERFKVGDRGPGGNAGRLVEARTVTVKHSDQTQQEKADCITVTVLASSVATPVFSL